MLARAGCEVSVVARSDYDTVARDGYRIGVNRAELIRPAVAAHTAIVLVQNGIGIEDEVAAAFPRNEVLSGVAYAAVSREGPAHIKHHSDYTRLFLGCYPRGTSANAEHLQKLIQQGGASCTLTDDIVGARWQKCAWNTVFNPLSAIGGGLGTRDILAGEEEIAFVRAAIEEVAAIAAADGHPLPADTAERQIQGTLRMENYVSSMGQDFLAGRPMEIEALLGNAVRRARELGLAVPRLASLYATLLMISKHSPRSNQSR